jgi:hypothetical protein
MSVMSRAAKLTDSAISAEEVRQSERLRRACAAYYEDLVKHQRVKLRSLI